MSAKWILLKVAKFALLCYKQYRNNKPRSSNDKSCSVTFVQSHILTEEALFGLKEVRVKTEIHLLRLKMMFS